MHLPFNIENFIYYLTQFKQKVCIESIFLEFFSLISVTKQILQRFGLLNSFSNSFKERALKNHLIVYLLLFKFILWVLVFLQIEFNIFLNDIIEVFLLFSNNSWDEIFGLVP